jgi:hypothetical protein
MTRWVVLMLGNEFLDFALLDRVTQVHLLPFCNVPVVFVLFPFFSL